MPGSIKCWPTSSGAASEHTRRAFDGRRIPAEQQYFPEVWGTLVGLAEADLLSSLFSATDLNITAGL
jgi:hypothetical protein